MNLFKYSINNYRFHSLAYYQTLLFTYKLNFKQNINLIKQTILKQTPPPNATYYLKITNLNNNVPALTNIITFLLEQNKIDHLIIEPSTFNQELITYFITLKEKVNLIIALPPNLNNIINQLQHNKIKIIINIINDNPLSPFIMKLKPIGFNFKNTLPASKLPLNQYLTFVANQLELIPPHFLIYQILKQENDLTNLINEELLVRNAYQGFKTNIINYCHQLILNQIKPNDIVIDATCGNGQDTLFLARLVPHGHVYGFDIQTTALLKTKQLLTKNHFKNYTLFSISHSKMLELLPALQNKINIITFNLGYLPHGNKQITTQPETTIKALNASLKLLKRGGLCLIVVYRGHQTGFNESIILKAYLKTLNKKFKINYYYNTTNKKAPYLITIKKYPF